MSSSSPRLIPTNGAPTAAAGLVGAALLVGAVVACAGGRPAIALALGAFGGVFLGWWATSVAGRSGAVHAGRTAQGVFDSIVDPVIVIGVDGLVLDANAAVVRVFGWRPDELLGRNVNVLMGEPYRTEHDTYIRNYLDTGSPRAIGRVRKVMGRHRDGRDFPCEISISELTTGHGKRRFIGMVRDVSDREEMSAMLTHAERLAAVGELAASVAHEVNNPVNTILNCVQLLRDGDDDPTLLEDVDAEANRIAEIVRELLDLSRDNKETVGLFDLQVVVVRTTGLLRRRLMSRGVELRVEVEGGLPKLMGRQQELQQVLLNLVINAQDAFEGHDGERLLSIRGGRAADADGEWVVLEVADTGPGIAAEARERIFEPFYTTKSDRGGSGLGLAVSRRIVERYGGRMSVDSELGRGTTFRIELPASDGAEPEIDET